MLPIKPYTPEELKKIKLVKKIFKDAWEAMEKSLDEQMEKAEQEWLTKPYKPLVCKGCGHVWGCYEDYCECKD